jgi:hypothetical protein
MICLGDDKTARITSFFILFWVIVQEVAYEGKMTLKKSLILKIPLSILGAIILLLTFIAKDLFDYRFTFILYTVIYELLTFIVIIPDFIKETKKKAEAVDSADLGLIKLFRNIIKGNKTLVVHGYFIICIAITLAMIV